MSHPSPCVTHGPHRGKDVLTSIGDVTTAAVKLGRRLGYGESHCAGAGGGAGGAQRCSQVHQWVCVCVCRIPRRRGCLPRVGGGPEIRHCPGYGAPSPCFGKSLPVFTCFPKSKSVLSLSFRIRTWVSGVHPVQMSLATAPTSVCAVGGQGAASTPRLSWMSGCGGDRQS